MKFRDRIKQANPDLVKIPTGYKRYDHVMVLRSTDRLSPELGETILSEFPWCRTVYQHTTTTGQSRIPELVLLAGVDEPEVTHRENGVSYRIDLRRITFSGGNRYLRERLVDLVDDGEFLFDMFAAVGNLSMQPLVHRNIDALLVERNPYTFSYLQQTLKLNKLDPQLARNTDCRSVSLTDQADRIFMGYHDVDQSHLATAVQAGTERFTIHLHPIVKVDEWDAMISHHISVLTDLNVIINTTETHQVKTFAPGLEHIEIILEVEKK